MFKRKPDFEFKTIYFQGWMNTNRSVKEFADKLIKTLDEAPESERSFRVIKYKKRGFEFSVNAKNESYRSIPARLSLRLKKDRGVKTSSLCIKASGSYLYRSPQQIMSYLDSYFNYNKICEIVKLPCGILDD